MKATLQSIKPQHCANIAAYIKKIEVRKSKPNIPTPFKVYIYETKGRYETSFETANPCILVPNECYMFNNCYCGYRLDEILSGACLSENELQQYGKGNTLYGWQISNLVVYDKPKELYDFIKPCTDPYQYCQGCEHGHINYPSDVETYEDLSGCCFDTVCLNRIRKAPQSWCYVEEV